VRTAAKLLAVVLLVGVAAGGWLVWRLAQAPISLDALTPRIETALNASDAAVRVSVGATELAWAGWRRGVYLRARDVRITGTDGAAIANIPALALRLALRALLRRQIAFSRIELLSPLLRLVREPDGRIGLGLGAEAEARPGNPLPHDALEALLTPPGRVDLPMAYLRRVEVGDGEVVVEDRGSGVLLRAPRIHLALWRRAGGVAATLSGDLRVGNQVIPIESTAQLQAEPRALAVHLGFRGVNPAAVATRLVADPAAPLVAQHPDLVKQLGGIKLDLAGSIEVHLDGNLHPATAQLDLTGSAGSIAVPGTRAQRWDLKGLQLAARFDAAADEARIEKFDVDFGGPSLTASARLAGLTGPGTITADAALAGLAVDELARYWPEGAAAGAREWLTTNLSHGTVNNAAVHLSGAVGIPLPQNSSASASGPPPASFVLKELNGSVAFTRLTVRYVPTMPVVTDVAGSGTFTADAWALRVNSGVLRGLRVGPATVTISKITSKEPTRIAIAADVDGPLADALEVLDAEPLGFAKEVGVVPSSVAGDVRTHVGFDFPLDGEIGLDNLGLKVSAQLERVDVPRLIQGWSVAGGDLKIEANGTDLDLSGHARVEGTPLDVEWHEALARHAAVRRRVTVKGQIDSAGRAAIGFDLAPWVDGPIVLDLRLTQPDLATGRIDLRLDLTPAHIEVTQLGVRKPPGEAGRAEGTLRLARGEVTAVDPFEVSMPSCEIQGSAARNGRRWSTIDATGTLGAARADVPLPGGFTLGVRPAGSVESFSLTSSDVATLFRAVDGEGRGGRLDVGGTVDLVHAAHTFDSHVEITDFTVTRAPTLARILTLASLSGIREMLFSQGVKFNRISARVSGNASIIDVGDLVAVGDSIGVAAGGRIDHADNLVNLSGSIVPAYYGVNATLGKIPVLRDLFSGRGGLGVLGIDFTVTGSLARPDVSVHPLQSLTPGILRRFSDMFRSQPAEKKGATGRERW
jgi:hypothetical protein